MSNLEKEIIEINTFDWAKLKEVVCGLAATLSLVCASVPGGWIKTVLCGISGLLNLICAEIPNKKGEQ